MNDNDRALCAATAGLLRASGVIAGWGLALALIAGLVLALTGRSLPAPSWAAFAVIALAGLPERYLALRLRLDTALFDGLAQIVVTEAQQAGAGDEGRLERQGERGP